METRMDRIEPRMWQQLWEQSNAERAEAERRAIEAEHELAQLERDYRKMKRRLTLAIAAALSLANAAFWATLMA